MKFLQNHDEFTFMVDLVIKVIPMKFLLGFKMRYFVITFCIIVSFLLGFASPYDYFSVFYNSREIFDGDTIICTEDDSYEWRGQQVRTYLANINVVNRLDYSNLNRAVIVYTDCPSREEYTADPKAWGTAKLCYHGGDANGEMASCMGQSGTVRIPDRSLDCFNWEVHLENSPVGVKSIYELLMIAGEGELQWNNYELIEGSEFRVTIVFQDDDKAGIGMQVCDESAPEYFTFQGVRINNPGKGFFIEKKGNQIKKIYR